MEYKELLADFGAKVGGGMDLVPDASGMVNLSVDDMSFSILGLEEVGQVVLSGEVGEVPPVEHQERLYRALLIANSNLAGTNGATLALDPDGGQVRLCRLLPLALLDVESFSSEVENFLNTLEFWHRIVTDFRGEVQNEGATSSETAADLEKDFPSLGGLNGFVQV